MAVGFLLHLVVVPVLVGPGVRSEALPATLAHVVLETQAERMGPGCAAGAADVVAVGAHGHFAAAVAVVAPPSPSVAIAYSFVDIYRQNWRFQC